MPRNSGGSYECERCGYPAPNKERLIKHLKDGMQCRPLKSKIPLQDLLNKLRPPVPQEDLACSFCSLQCKSKTGLATHLRYCKKKEQPNETSESADAASTSANVPVGNGTLVDKQATSKHIYFHKNVVVHKELHPFHENIEWDTFDIDEKFFLDCCECKAHGLIELFSFLHRHPNHDNIKWSNNKLVVYNGKGWIEATEQTLIKHMGFLYSILEEKWFDYQSNIRCGNIEINDIIDSSLQRDIDKFLYNDIVDDDSVFFHCKDYLYEYLEGLKE